MIGDNLFNSMQSPCNRNNYTPRAGYERVGHRSFRFIDRSTDIIEIHLFDMAPQGMPETDREKGSKNRKRCRPP